MKLAPHEEKHLSILDDISAECTLFLKRNKDFPISDIKEVALYGSGVRHTLKGGTGSGNVDVHFFDNIEQAFLKEGVKVTTTEWLDRYDELRKERKKQFIKEVKKEAKEYGVIAPAYSIGRNMEEFEYDIPLTSTSEIAIYALSRNQGEGQDRRLIKGDWYLTDTEIRDILELNRKHKRFLLVLNVASPLDISPVLEVDNILLLSQLGTRTSKTLFDIVTGKKYPSGKLSSTWAKIEEHPCFEEFGNDDDAYYKEGIFVGYRYFESFVSNSLFEFGFGSGFTDFKITPIEVKLDGDQVNIGHAYKEYVKHSRRL